MSKPGIQMDASTARDCVKQIKQSMSGVRDLILRLHRQKGWLALGYKSWRDCVTSEFEQSKSSLYRELEYAEIQEDIGEISQSGKNEIPGATLKPMSCVEKKDRKKVWKKAKELNNGETPKPVHVSKAIETVLPQEPEDKLLAEKVRDLKAAQDLEKLTAKIWAHAEAWPDRHNIECLITELRENANSIEAEKKKITQMKATA